MKPHTHGAIRLRWSLLAVLGLCTCPLVLFGQDTGRVRPTHITRESYARADSLAVHQLARKLRNGVVIPHWIERRDEFWYRRQTLTGFEFVQVDAATGKREHAFNHRVLAAGLSATADTVITADTLPVTHVTYTPAGVVVRASINGESYDCRFTPQVRCQPAPLWPSGLSISPDSSWGVLTRDGNLWLRDMKSGQERPLTTDGEPDYGYGIAVGGFSFISQMRAAQGRQLAPVGALWSPDSRTIVVPRVDQRHVGLYPFLEAVPLDGSFRPKLYQKRMALVGEKPPTRDWFVFDVATGASRRLALPSGSRDHQYEYWFSTAWFSRTWWSADGRRLYSVGSADNAGTAYLFEVDVTSGRSRIVIEEHLRPRAELKSGYGWPNVHVTADGKEAIWFSQRDGWGHLYLYDVRTGQLRHQITAGDWLVRDLMHVDEKARRIYFTGAGREGGNPYYRYVYRVNFDGSGLTLLSRERADRLLLSGPPRLTIRGGSPAVVAAPGETAISPSGRYLVYSFSTPGDPGQSVIRSTSDARLITTFERADARDVLAAGFRPPEEFVVTAADGKTDLWGVLYRPSHFDPRKRYPVIDHEYTSPGYAVVPRGFPEALQGAPPGMVSAAALAELGFIVVVLDARGTPYRSRAFEHATHPGWFDRMGLDDHVAAIRQLAARFPYVDSSRVGIIGESYGGLAVIRAMLEFPDFFKVGVAGVASAVRYAREISLYPYQGRPVYSDGTALRPTPTETPTNWANIDVRQQTARLRGNLLIYMGALDENVPYGSTLQFTDALMKANKRFDFIYLPSSAHGSGEAYRSFVTWRTYDYFVRHLLDATPPVF